MSIWQFDENRVDFVTASLASMEAAPDAGAAGRGRGDF